MTVDEMLRWVSLTFAAANARDVSEVLMVRSTP